MSGKVLDLNGRKAPAKVDSGMLVNQPQVPYGVCCNGCKAPFVLVGPPLHPVSLDTLVWRMLTVLLSQGWRVDIAGLGLAAPRRVTMLDARGMSVPEVMQDVAFKLDVWCPECRAAKDAASADERAKQRAALAEAEAAQAVEAAPKDNADG